MAQFYCCNQSRPWGRELKKHPESEPWLMTVNRLEKNSEKGNEWLMTVDQRTSFKLRWQDKIPEAVVSRWAVLSCLHVHFMKDEWSHWPIDVKTWAIPMTPSPLIFSPPNKLLREGSYFWHYCNFLSIRSHPLFLVWVTCPVRMLSPAWWNSMAIHQLPECQAGYSL